MYKLTCCFTVLDRPASADINGKYNCQIILSWDEKKAIPVPDASPDRIRLLKSLSANWAEPFRSLVHNIPGDETEVQILHVEDWIFHPRSRPITKGRIALMGDSAHTMTMCMRYLLFFCSLRYLVLLTG